MDPTIYLPVLCSSAYFMWQYNCTGWLCARDMSKISQFLQKVKWLLLKTLFFLVFLERFQFTKVCNNSFSADKCGLACILNRLIVIMWSPGLIHNDEKQRSKFSLIALSTTRILPAAWSTFEMNTRSKISIEWTSNTTYLKYWYEETAGKSTVTSHSSKIQSKLEFNSTKLRHQSFRCVRRYVTWYKIAKHAWTKTLRLSTHGFWFYESTPT